MENSQTIAKITETTMDTQRLWKTAIQNKSEKALTAVRRSFHHGIPSSHKDENNMRDLVSAPKNSADSIKIFSEEQSKIVDEQGSEEKIIGKSYH